MNTRLTEETVHYGCPDGFKMPSFTVRPSQEGLFPGIVFVIEASGLHAEMQRLAREVAAEGYAVVAPDLLSRGNPIGCLIQIFKDLSAESGRGVDDLIAARNWLSQQPYVDREKIAVMGFCMGGGFALLLSKTGLFQAAADFYGRPPASLAGACPIFGSFGERDLVVGEKIEHLKRELEVHTIPHEITVYPNVGHGFMNRQENWIASVLGVFGFGWVGYDSTAAADAKQKLLLFLAKYL